MGALTHFAVCREKSTLIKKVSAFLKVFCSARFFIVFVRRDTKCKDTAELHTLVINNADVLSDFLYRVLYTKTLIQKKLDMIQTPEYYLVVVMLERILLSLVNFCLQKLF